MIKKTHHAQSAVNLALLNHVNQRSPCDYACLLQAFCTDPASKVVTKRFNDKLSYLLYTEQLQCSGRAQWRQFWLGPLAGLPQPTVARARKVAPRASYLPEHVLGSPRQAAAPRTVDVMHCPAYTPPPNSAMRPGSLDYQRHASFGVRC